MRAARWSGYRGGRPLRRREVDVRRALAEQLDAAVLSTDDFAWWHSYFDWHELLIAKGIEPLRSGQPVDYRPPAWIERHRPGSITVPAVGS